MSRVILISFLVLGIVIFSGCSNANTIQTPCPPKIEYQQKEVEKTVYVDKIKNQFECLDGTFKDKKEECPNIQEIIKNMPIKDNADICRNNSNKNLERIELTPNVLGSITAEPHIKWYPSLNEGWVEIYFLKIKNTGCTIIEREKISLTIKVYDGNNIIYSKEKDKEGFSYVYLDDSGSGLMGNRKIYPQVDDAIRTPFNVKTTGGMSGLEYFKFNKEGKYPVKFILYYGNDIIAQAEDVVNIS